MPVTLAVSRSHYNHLSILLHMVQHVTDWVAPFPRSRNSPNSPFTYPFTYTWVGGNLNNKVLRRSLLWGLNSGHPQFPQTLQHYDVEGFKGGGALNWTRVSRTADVSFSILNVMDNTVFVSSGHWLVLR